MKVRVEVDGGRRAEILEVEGRAQQVEEARDVALGKALGFLVGQVGKRMLQTLQQPLQSEGIGVHPFKAYLARRRERVMRSVAQARRARAAAEV